MEEGLLAMFCFPVLTLASSVRKSTQWPTNCLGSGPPARKVAAYRSKTAGAARSHMMAAVRKTRQHASHEATEPGPGISLVLQLATRTSCSWPHGVRRGATLRNPRMARPRLAPENRHLVVCDFLSLHRILPSTALNPAFPAVAYFGQAYFGQAYFGHDLFWPRLALARPLWPRPGRLWPRSVFGFFETEEAGWPLWPPALPWPIWAMALRIFCGQPDFGRARPIWANFGALRRPPDRRTVLRWTA